MRVIGTAGHVDHGKSTLVRALSGIDPDRLKEEKARGMTIDLGFAWIQLNIPVNIPVNIPAKISGNAPGQVTSESIGIVDVPGHIDFIKNMLAGVGGLDAVVLVIAADEGVMPQTREHLAILDLLAVPAAVVALTKVDLVDDPEWLELVELDISELLDKTHLAGSPIVRVSASKGTGLIPLRQAIGAQLAKLPPRRNRARPRLPIDRIFTLSGFGTVVTGTLQDGELTSGDMVEILPSGLSARIRSLQTHRQQVAVGQPGSRLAINLSNVEVDQLRRGDVVVKPGTVQTTTLIDVRFRLLADVGKPLRHNQQVDFFSGASETSAHVRILSGEGLEPGQEGWLQLRLETPVVVAAGDRYILRQASPSATLGGGDVLSPHPRQRWKRDDPAVLARLRTLAHGAPDEILLQTLTRHPFVTAKELFARSELDLVMAQDALQELQAAGAVLSIQSGQASQPTNEAPLCTIDAWQQVCRQLRAILSEFHQQYPLRRGMARGEVRNRLQTALGLSALPVKLFNALLERAQSPDSSVLPERPALSPTIVSTDDTVVWLADFQVTLTFDQQYVVDVLLDAYAAAPFAPPNLQETVRMVGNNNELLEMLIEQGRLVRLVDVLLRKTDYETMVETILAHLRQHGSITLAEVRDRFQTSRKYAQAVLEEMDTRRLTRREGDARILR